MIGLGIGVSRLRRRGGGSIPDLLYNLYGAPAAGVSTRLNDKNYTGGLLRALAYDGSTQQGQADVLPYDTGDGYWVDLNSRLINLDATATGRGLTDSDTLGDLVDAGGANYDGIVPTWYGQAGGIDVTQSSLGSMPRIVDAGTLEVDNGKPAVYFDGSNRMKASFVLSSQVVSTQLGRINGQEALSDSFDNNNYNSIYSQSATEARLMNKAGEIINNDHVRGNQELYAYISQGNNSELSVNNGVPVVGNLQTGDMDGVTLGSLADFSNADLLGYAQEYSFWDDLTVYNQISAIKSNINNAFNIY